MRSRTVFEDSATEQQRVGGVISGDEGAIAAHAIEEGEIVFGQSHDQLAAEGGGGEIDLVDRDAVAAGDIGLFNGGSGERDEITGDATRPMAERGGGICIEEIAGASVEDVAQEGGAGGILGIDNGLAVHAVDALGERAVCAVQKGQGSDEHDADARAGEPDDIVIEDILPDFQVSGAVEAVEEEDGGGVAGGLDEGGK